MKLATATFEERRKFIQTKIRELNDNLDIPHTERDKEMIRLDGMLEDLELEERLYEMEDEEV